MVMWTGWLLFTWVFSNMFSTYRFVNNDTVKYAIIDGYASNYFIQTTICQFTYMVFDTIFSTLIFIILILSVFKIRFIKIVGIFIIEQNIITLMLNIWSRYFINTDTVIIDIKLWLTITLIIACFCMWLLLKHNMFIVLLCIITLLQIMTTIYLVIVYFKHITDIQIIFQCFNGIVLPILYWLLILRCKKDNI